MDAATTLHEPASAPAAAGERSWAPPRSLSPSSMGAFTSCPLAFRFSYVQRLPEPPSEPACRGTLVHLALQHLLWRPPAERTPANALADLDRAVAELSVDREFVELGLDDAGRAHMREVAAGLIERYFELEDPTGVRPIGLELRVEADLDGVTVRGVIDRLELGSEGELVVTDYKTGQSPSERWEQKSLAGVHVYSVLCERLLGRRPDRVQLLYLSKPEAIVARPTDGLARGVVTKAGALAQAVRQACARDDFRPRPSALCDWCGFREFCPAHGGAPESAPVVLRERAATAAGRPPLPLVPAST